MTWVKTSLRERRLQVRDDIAAHVRGADATVPNSLMRGLAEAQASLTHDNDLHLDDYVVRMMMPDTAEGEFAERWANILLPAGRKPASFASGFMTVTGVSGSSVPGGSELTASVIDATGQSTRLTFWVSVGVTLSTSSAAVEIEAMIPGAASNLAEGAQLSFVAPPGGIDGVAVVAAPGLTGGADQETDAALVERYIDRIQNPPHGGAAHDYVAWALEVPGVTRAWSAQEMGVGTITVRFMMDVVNAATNGIPGPGDLSAVLDYITKVRPVTVANLYVPATTAQPLNFTIADLANDTPEVRANIATEIAQMLKSRASPGATIYASWIREAISAATGEDHHDITISNVVPSSAGHIIVPGVITYA